MQSVDETVDLLQELDSISKIHVLQRDDIDKLIWEFSTRIVKTLRIERISAWLFDQDRKVLVSVGEYDSRTKLLKKESVLRREDFPVYFEGLYENKLIIAPNIFDHPLTKEFTRLYSIPNEIISLMDVPLRINGELIGVMCFEKTGEKVKQFTRSEQSFAFSCATVFAASLEARQRRAAQSKLAAALAEKDILMREMNHRINNNFGILISLIRLKKADEPGSELMNFLNEYEQRIQSIKKIHDLLIQTHSYTTVNLSDYMNELLSEFKNSYPEISAQFDEVVEFSELQVASKVVMNLGLITTEILINSLKHSLQVSSNHKLQITFRISETNELQLTISDSGAHFDFEGSQSTGKLGLSIIKELAENLGMICQFPTPTDGTYQFRLPL